MAEIICPDIRKEFPNRYLQTILNLFFPLIELVIMKISWGRFDINIIEWESMIIDLVAYDLYIDRYATTAFDIPFNTAHSYLKSFNNLNGLSRIGLNPALILSIIP